MITDAGSVGKLSKIRSHKTSTGIKDVYFEAFLDCMHHAYKDQGTRAEKQAALDDFKGTLSENILSPVWRIRGTL